MKTFYILFTMGVLACSPAENPTQASPATEQELKPYSEIYENGQIRIQGNLLGDKRHGLWVAYYEDGVKWSEDEYYQGERNGTTISYYPTGMFRYKGTYIDDLPAGKWTFYDETGRVEKEMDYSKK